MSKPNENETPETPSMIRRAMALDLANRLLKENGCHEKALLRLCFDTVDLATVANQLADRNSAFDKVRGHD
jgi:hypothetical protein